MSIRRPNANDPKDVARAVTDVVDALNAQELQRVFHSGIIFKDLVLSGLNLEVRHGLGRVPTVVQALLQSAAVDILVDTPHADPTNFVYVRAGGTVTVNLLVA